MTSLTESAPAGDRVVPDAVDAADTHAFVARVERYALDVLAPAAAATDRERVSPGTIDDLRDLGLLNYFAPVHNGGAGLDSHAERRLHELLSYADLNVWLVWAQHAGAGGRIAGLVAQRDRAVDPLLASVVRGEVLVGAGISDVRRYPSGHLAATRAQDGWVVDGTISWFTGWGLNHAVLLAAVEAGTEQVITGVVPIDEHFVATELDLHAAYGSRTERVEIRGAFIPDSLVLAVTPMHEWQSADASLTTTAGAHIFGQGRRILDELEAESQAVAVVTAWRPYFEQVRARAYELADAPRTAPDAGLAERLDLKVRATDAVSHLSRALVLARAGRALQRDDTAQLHARAALYLSVQGQTRTVRRAQLDHLAAAVPVLP